MPIKGPMPHNPDKNNPQRALVKGPWVDKSTALLVMAMGATAYATGRNGVAQALILGGIILYLQNEQLLPWQ